MLSTQLKPTSKHRLFYPPDNQRFSNEKPFWLTLIFLTAFVILGQIPSNAWAATIYVKHNASGNNNGTSWTDAYTDLKTTLLGATSGDEIWVAQGTYKPSVPAGRSATFQLISGVNIYGGFQGVPGTEGLKFGKVAADKSKVRDIDVYKTILSGDIGTTSNNSDNSYHVVTAGSGVLGSTIIEGITIQDGNANGAGENNGGGVLNSGSPKFINVIFSTNTASNNGGGIYNEVSGKPTLTNTTFSSNTAGQNGGGMYNEDRTGNSFTMSRVTFQGNEATAGNGGGLYAGNGSITQISNSLFSGNLAGGNGGGIYNKTITATLSQVTMSGNLANGKGGGIYNDGGTLTINNSILWQNKDDVIDESAQIHPNTGSIGVYFSIVEGGWSGTGNDNLNSDPFFNTAIAPTAAPTINGNFNLAFDAGPPVILSPAIESGNNSLATGYSAGPPEIADNDLDGKTRIIKNTVDRGAYETQAPSVLSITCKVPSSCGPIKNTEVTFKVTFDEAVKGVDVTDFILTATSGTINVTDASSAPLAISSSGTPLNNVNTTDYSISPDGTSLSATYNVTVKNIDTGTDGQLRLDIVDNDNIRNQYDMPLGNSGLGSGDFSTGKKYTIDTVSPTVTIVQESDNAGVNDEVTSNATINFTVTFSEEVTGFNENDVIVRSDVGDATFGTLVKTVVVNSLDPKIYNVAISGMDTGGIVAIDIPADKATDAATNGNVAFDTSTVPATNDNEVTWNVPAILPPAAPTGLTATAISQTQINLSWTDNSGTDETGFKIERPAGTLITTTAADVISYSNTGLTCGTTYTYQVKATHNVNGDSAATNVASATTHACTVTPPTPPVTPPVTPPPPPPPPTTADLTVTVSGTGNGSVTSNPSGIDCGIENVDCTYSFPFANAVILTPEAALGSEFDSWSGDSDCSDGELSMSSNTRCVATFRLLPLTLTASYQGNGSIKSIPLAIDCSETNDKCAREYDSGRRIKLIATPDSGWSFHKWEGDCDENGFVTIVDTNKQCEAIFVDGIIPPEEPPEEPPVEEPPEAAVSLWILKTGEGSVTSQPAGIDCGADCQKDYGTDVADIILIANPDTGWKFEGWRGHCNEAGHVIKDETVSTRQCRAVFVELAPGETIPEEEDTEPDPVPTSLNLNVSKVGNGTITSTGINCGADCAEVYDSGSVIMLVPTPDSNWKFEGWTGDCDTDGRVTMQDNDKQCEALFVDANAEPFDLYVAKTGEGTVTSQPTGIDCGETCDSSFSSGIEMTLIATPDTGWVFEGWRGHCDDMGHVTLVSDFGFKQCRAVFVEAPPGTLPDNETPTTNDGNETDDPNSVEEEEIITPTHLKLTVMATNGVVASQPNGIDCGSDCVEDFAYSSEITLTPTPDEGWKFEGWTGDCNTDGRVTLLDNDKQCEAIFVDANAEPFDLFVAKTGEGTVTSQPTGIDCGETCDSSFSSGIEMTLIATPDTGWVFEGWRGHCDDAGSVTLEGDFGFKQCRAVFVEAPPGTLPDNETPTTNDGNETDDPNSVEEEKITPTHLKLTVKTTNGVIASQPSGIDCGSDCVEDFTYSSEITLTPTPDEGWKFEGWMGDCNTDGRVTMLDNDKQCEAIFVDANAEPFDLFVAKTGEGIVTSQPTGIDCGKICDSSFSSGIKMTLVATPDNGWAFEGWRGHCDDAGSVTLEGNFGFKQCRAVFVEAPVVSEADENNPDSSTEEVSGDLASTSSEAATNEPALSIGEMLTDDDLSALLTGETSLTGNTSESENKPIIITTADGQQITIRPVDCGDNCPENLSGSAGASAGTANDGFSTSSNMFVELTATPTPGFKFAGWSGDCHGNDETVIVTLNNAENCKPEFIAISDETGTRTDTDITTSNDNIGTPSQSNGNTTTTNTIAGNTGTQGTVSSNNTGVSGNTGNNTGISGNNGTSGVNTNGVANDTGISNETPTAIAITLGDGNIVSTGNAPTSTNVPTQSLEITLSVGETVTKHIGNGTGILFIKEIPNPAFVSVDALKAFGDGNGDLILTGLKVGNTEMIISDKDSSQNILLSIKVIPSSHGQKPESTATVKMKAIRISLKVDQTLDVLITGGEGLTSIIELPNDGFVLLKDWQPDNGGAATFTLTGLNVGKTRLVVSDSGTPSQKTEVIITVLANDSFCENKNAMEIDVKGNSMDSQACFIGKLSINGVLQSNHHALTRAEAQNFRLSAWILVPPKHLGEVVDILLVGVHTTSIGEAFYTRDEQRWRMWNSQISGLTTAQEHPDLPEITDVFIFKGDLSAMPGEFTIFIGYRLKNGHIVFNGLEPIHFFVGN
ncbi:hypothetical protein [Candidatus Parabeggiatoa sp. HSG14]|uniref:InlB B-repeat-containing protein n=1 Tax=Candidatus Parabeggiatoa sp. HSG14 TaxID=3055593 RepID=UPI0025A6D0B9|nr:hypothetical protein [Thiotrichales bacterium HSG14]